MSKRLLCYSSVALAASLAFPVMAAKPIQHDADHYVLLHQYQDQWAAEDEEIDQRLAQIHERNGGKKPNIVINQGFDYASFPMHNKVSYSFLTREAELDARTTSFTPTTVDPDYGLDKTFRLYDWVTQVEGSKGGKLREWAIKPGEPPDMEMYKRVNQRFQEQALESLRTLAKGDKPFFLNYWPQIPVAVLRAVDDGKCLTPNCGRWVEATSLVDQYIGEVLDEIEKLGIADNTIVMGMGDNGPMKQDLPASGYIDWLFRGTKGTALEGGHRVGAFIRGPGVIEPGAIAGDMVFVSDLYTTFARIAGNTDAIPRDRIVDGVDQTPFLLKGDTHGRRDYVHLYEVNNLKATVKQDMKIHWHRRGSTPLWPVFSTSTGTHAKTIP